LKHHMPEIVRQARVQTLTVVKCNQIRGRCSAAATSQARMTVVRCRAAAATTLTVAPSSRQVSPYSKSETNPALRPDVQLTFPHEAVGLEPVSIGAALFVNIGERTNVTLRLPA
jgi:hypothetical protein